MKRRNREIDSPSGLDLNPQPPAPRRLSKRAGMLALVVVFGVVASVGYGIITRNNRAFDTVYREDTSQRLTAATDAGRAIASQIPNGAVGGSGPDDQLRPPVQAAGHPPELSSGQKTLPPLTSAPAPVATVPQPRAPTAEEKRLAAAYSLEMQALDAPITAQGWATAPVSDAGGSQLANMLRLAQRPSGVPAAADQTASGSAEGYDAQNTQDGKERFLARARAAAAAGYVNSTRTKPVSPYEIKAGWDIPAVLEQALNSDLPGEIRALVRENVYDTATGRHLLIPQGARLVGTYDSRVSYGQNGIQVVWSRLIYPNGSSINLEGMIGQDSGGAAGLRHDVDNHYKRLLGFGLLTSLFSASFQLSQTRRGTVLGYPSPAETAGSAVGAQISQLGADVTRRNLNVQPTIKVPVGYRFNVRVNRDVLFESPYSASH